MRLHDLPDDILITIFSQCDIDTLFAAHLSNRSLRTVIDSYITAIAPHVARNTFPHIPHLLSHPTKGYSLQWLRERVYHYLAAVALDKDKLRNCHYVNAGFPYGIPCENTCPEAVYWRQRVSNGWQILQRFYVVSRNVYSRSSEELCKRPTMLRKVSSEIKVSRLWQTVSCPYQACTEHGVRQVFNKRAATSGHGHGCEGGGERRRSTAGKFIAEVEQRESIILKKRIELLQSLTQDDLQDYIYVWRLLLWAFRAYRKPGSEDADKVDGRPAEAPRKNWQCEISNILHGCSWLNWFVLHHGSAPFWQQWLPTHGQQGQQRAANHVRDSIWREWNRRSHHQIELEREYILKFEFMVRRRCLTPERLESLGREIAAGAIVKTMHLDCIPWDIDRSPIALKTARDFPWYKQASWVWLDRDVWVMVGKSNGQMLYTTSRSCPGHEATETGEVVANEEGRGSLQDVSYLMYLGVEEGLFSALGPAETL